MSHPWAAVEASLRAGRPVHAQALPALDASGRSLRDAVFNRCDLRGARFTGATLVGVCFAGCDLSGADFSAAQFERVSFSNCPLAGSDWRALRARCSRSATAQWPAATGKSRRSRNRPSRNAICPGPAARRAARAHGAGAMHAGSQRLARGALEQSVLANADLRGVQLAAFSARASVFIDANISGSGWPARA